MEFNRNDGNELIRIFMGREFREHSYYDYNYETYISRLETIEDMQYDSDWNWLMDVIDRIEYIIEHEKPHPLHTRLPNYFYISLGQISLTLNDGSYYKIKGTGKTRKEQNWKCCVEFIMWLNSHDYLNNVTKK